MREGALPVNVLLCLCGFVRIRVERQFPLRATAQSDQSRKNLVEQRLFDHALGLDLVDQLTPEFQNFVLHEVRSRTEVSTGVPASSPSPGKKR